MKRVSSKKPKAQGFGGFFRGACGTDPGDKFSKEPVSPSPDGTGQALGRGLEPRPLFPAGRFTGGLTKCRGSPPGAACLGLSCQGWRRGGWFVGASSESFPENHFRNRWAGPVRSRGIPTIKVSNHSGAGIQVWTAVSLRPWT